MKTQISQLRKLVKDGGGTLEDDGPSNDGIYRYLQVCAPEGYCWIDGGPICMHVFWARGKSSFAMEHNEEMLKDVADRLSCGMEEGGDWN